MQKGWPKGLKGLKACLELGGGFQHLRSNKGCCAKGDLAGSNALGLGSQSNLFQAMLYWPRERVDRIDRRFSVVCKIEVKPMIRKNLKEFLKSFRVEWNGRGLGDDLHIINKSRDNYIMFVLITKGAQDECNCEGKKEDRDGIAL